MTEEERQSLRIPLSCPICQRIMRGKSTGTYLRYGACVDCTINFIEGRESRWKSGWRPSEEQLKATYPD